MNKNDLMQIMIDLELANEELRAELLAFDEVMRRVGFTHGIETVKATAIELTKNFPQ